MRDNIFPFANLSELTKPISVVPNKKYKQIIEVETREEITQAVQNYVRNPSIEMQLKKLNHGISIQIKGNTVILDVAVQLDSGNTAKEAEVALRNALSIAIKAHQPKIYIREKAFSLLPDTNPIKNSVFVLLNFLKSVVKK